MRVENVKIDPEAPEALETADDCKLVEVGPHGVSRVFIVAVEDDIDAPAAAHRLLARLMAQLSLLNDAAKAAGKEIVEPEK